MVFKDRSHLFGCHGGHICGVCLSLCHNLEILYQILPWYLRIRAKFHRTALCHSKFCTFQILPTSTHWYYTVVPKGGSAVAPFYPPLNVLSEYLITLLASFCIMSHDLISSVSRGGGRARSLYATPPSPPPPPPPPRVLRDGGLGTWRQRRPPFFCLAPTAPPFLV